MKPEKKYYVECRACGEPYNVWRGDQDPRPDTCRKCGSTNIDARLIEVDGERLIEEDIR
jgi:hypothetical protein